MSAKAQEVWAELYLGEVKWFGGYNAKTERDNDFGFIEAKGLDDIFVHKSQLKNTPILKEGETVIFRKANSKKGVAAADVVSICSALLNIDTLTPAVESFLIDEIKFEQAMRSKSMHLAMATICNNEKFTGRLFSKLNDIGLSKRNQLRVISDSSRKDELITNYFLSKSEFLANFTELGGDNLTTDYIDENIAKLSDYFQELSVNERCQLLGSMSGNISFSAVLYLIFKESIPHPEEWESQERYYHRPVSFSQQLEDFVQNIVLKEKSDVKEFVRDAYKNCFESFSDFAKTPVIAPLIQPLLVKRKMFLKDLSFTSDVANNSDLNNNEEIWLLSTLLSLIHPELGNKHEDVEKIVLHEIWQAILNGRFDINHPEIFNLFPQCDMLMIKFPHMKLSCEAFHWQPKEGNAVYLCRSNRCHKPEVIPDLNKHYLDFSAFDWLAHYGVNYAQERRPSKKDFPIKLAGYLNRIRELRSKLDCRCCNQLMIPDMRYARTEKITLSSNAGAKHVTPVSAAYRLTVFKCNNNRCIEFDKGYYINHCLHYKCHQIIDSRDLTEKCSKGRYHCPQCHSCCSQHATTETTSSYDQAAKHKALYPAS